MSNKNELIEKEEENYVQLIDQTGVENAIGKLIMKNNSLLPDNVAVERIKNSMGFYVSTREDLMKLSNKGKMQMLYGGLKEAMLGLEAGIDYEIIAFKDKPTITRKKEGWFKIIDMIKPAEIVRFTNNVVFKGDEFSYNPVTEDIKHTPKVTSDKYEDIEFAYAYIKFANGFEKTVVLSKKDLDSIRKVSPSANTAFSPWTTQPVKMVKTKVVKELAKELFTLYSGRVNSALSQAINSDETSISRVDSKGYVVDDKTIYEAEVSEVKEPVKLDDIA
jgi:phage RecT family recombinase